MLYVLLLIIGFIGVIYIMKNAFDKPLTQHLKNKDNKDQREHERYQDEKKMNFWLMKNKIKNNEKKEVADFSHK